MCGLVFLRSSELVLEDKLARVTAALEAMKYRGPDESGQAILGDAVLGHNRLAIVGLSDSHQPMFGPGKKTALVFNGEIYNFKKLRMALSDRWSFRTNGDTEVLLAGLHLEGEEFISSLEGMWAFVFYDEVNGKIIAARDRTGKKPLFYKLNADTVCFASELSSINCLDDDRWEEDLSATSNYFRHGYTLPGQTFYKMVKEVLPGNYLVIDRDHKTRQKRYWAPAVCRFSGTYQDAVLKLRGLMEQSVEDRLVADVEVGSFLSGGLDSSIVAAIANKKRGGGLKTFTIGFEEKSYNESEFARIAARHIGSTHEEKILTGFDPALLDDMLLNKVGQPFHDSSILPTSLVSQLASKHVKVSLSGDGADELFCGYQRYKARYLMKLYSKAPKALREIFRKMISRFPENKQHHSRSLLKKAHLFMDAVDRYEAETPYFAPTFFSNEMYDELFNLKYESEPEIDFFVSSLLDKSENEIKRMMTADTFIYLPQDIHTKVDRASMACSLEARAPFMSTEIVEFALSLPTKYTLSWKNNKQILVDSFRDLLPSDIWRRSKQGFAVPLSFWFHQELGDRLLRLLDEDNGLSAVINLAMARHLLDVHRSGLRDYGYRLWLIYTYAVWRSRSPLLQCG